MREPRPALGRPRAPRKVLLLGLLTLGWGFAWYYFRAFQEVDQKAGRRHSPLFFLAFVPVAGPLFGLWYIRVETRALDTSRREVGLPPAMPAWHHAALLILGAVAAQVLAVPAWLLALGWLGEDAWVVGLAVTAWFAPVLAVPALARDINEFWHRLAGALM